MKKLAILLIFVMGITAVQAQKTARTSAFNYLNKGQLDKAKKEIDACILHEQTMNDARTWFYRGNIYLAYTLTDDAKFKGTEPNSLNTSYEAYQKALKLDVNKEYFEDIMQRMLIVGEQYYNKAVESFQAKKYPEAVGHFEKTVEVNEKLGRIDTLAMYNVAFVSELANDSQKSKDYYQRLIKINYKQPYIYTSLATIYKNEKDTVKAMEVVQEGRKIYPDDFNLLITETNFYLSRGDNERAQRNLNMAIDKDPNNPTIYFAVGTTYDQMGNIEQAEKNYQKAIELKPDYFDAIYNIGALYFNQGVKIQDDANKLDISDAAGYAKMKEKFDAAWLKALPILEKALELHPDDQNTLISLKQLYARLSMPEKLKAINEKMGGK